MQQPYRHHPNHPQWFPIQNILPWQPLEMQQIIPIVGRSGVPVANYGLPPRPPHGMAPFVQRGPPPQYWMQHRPLIQHIAGNNIPQQTDLSKRHSMYFNSNGVPTNRPAFNKQERGFHHQNQHAVGRGRKISGAQQLGSENQNFHAQKRMDGFQSEDDNFNVATAVEELTDNRSEVITGISFFLFLIFF
jgi:hypothetical protein